MSYDLAPRHCPDSADNRRHMANNTKAPCSESHPLIEAAQDQVNAWLAEAHQALQAGSAMRFTLPHPDEEQPALEARGLDPTTGHVLVELARVGGDAIPALYIGLFCQETTGVWRGVAGAYVPMCERCALPAADGDDTSRDLSLKVSRAAAAKIAAPNGSTDLPFDEVPEHLTPRAGWFDRRGLRVIRLPGAVGDVWRITDLADLTESDPSAALICTGPALTSEPNVLFLEDANEIGDVLPLLENGDRRPLATVRRGPADELRRLGTEPHSNTEPSQRFEFRTSRSRVPAGWGLVHQTTPPGHVVLTRAATTAVRTQLIGTTSASDQRFEFWTAPRLSPAGALDITALLQFRNDIQARHIND